VVKVGAVDDLLDQERDVCEPSLEARRDCGGELVQRLLPISEAELWSPGDGRGLSLARLIGAVNVDLVDPGLAWIQLAVFDRRELLAAHPTSDGGFRDAAALSRLGGRDKAGQLIVGLVEVTLPLGQFHLNLRAGEITELGTYRVHLGTAQQGVVCKSIMEGAPVNMGGHFEAPLQRLEIDAKLGGDRQQRKTLM
jgi:hypothetical protein